MSSKVKEITQREINAELLRERLEKEEKAKEEEEKKVRENAIQREHESETAQAEKVYPETGSSMGGIIAFPFYALSGAPKPLEETAEYQKIYNAHHEAWLRENYKPPEWSGGTQEDWENFKATQRDYYTSLQNIHTAPDYIDFIHGNPDDHNSQSLHKITRKDYEDKITELKTRNTPADRARVRRMVSALKADEKRREARTVNKLNFKEKFQAIKKDIHDAGGIWGVLKKKFTDGLQNIGDRAKAIGNVILHPREEISYHLENIKEKWENFKKNIRNPKEFLTNPANILKMGPVWSGRINFFYKLKDTHNLLEASKELNIYKTWLGRFNFVRKLIENPTNPLEAFKELQSFTKWERRIQRAKEIAEGIQNFLKATDKLKFLKEAFNASKLGNLLETLGHGLTSIMDGLGSLFGGGAAAEAAAAPVEVAAGGAAAGVGGGGLAVGIGIGIFFFIFLIVIIVFIVLLWILFTHPNPPVYVQVACSEEPGQLDAKGIGLAIASDFGISIEVNGNAATQLNNTTPNLPAIMAVEKRMYDDLCRLYGHAVGANGKPFNRIKNPDGSTTTALGSDNTLGNLFRGFDHYYDSTGVRAGGHITNLINLWIQPVNGKTQCTSEFANTSKLKSIDMDLWIYQPDQCLSNKSDQISLNTSDYALEFLLDKYLGLKLIDRVKDELSHHPNSNDPYYKNFPNNGADVFKAYNVYNDFLSTVYRKRASLLPNPECQTPGKDQPKNCFAVMIADYTTWGVYANFSLNACIPGQVGGDAQKTSDLASQLVNTIAKSQGNGGCGGVVTSGNASRCLYSLNPAPNPGGKTVEDELWSSAVNNGNLQCVGFAKAVSVGVKHDIGLSDASGYINNGTHAKDYDWIPNDGKNKIQAGDFPIWAAWAGQFITCQHIAVVVPFANGQPPGNKLFRVSQANGGGGTVDYGNYSTSGWCILHGWLRLKSAANGGGNSCLVGGNASAKIQPLNSGARNQFYDAGAHFDAGALNNNNPQPLTDQQWKSWIYASCSGCAFASEMNAYGKHLKCGDLLQYESLKGYWKLNGGFQGWNIAGIKDIANNYGFSAIAGQGDKKLDEIITIANAGNPVVVGLGGHILDMKGGDQNNVYLVDSLTGKFQTASRAQFLNGGVLGDPNFKWDGTYAIFEPK